MARDGSSARTPGQRAGLTRGVVLQAARDVLDEQGLDAMTMRAVAARLGVAPNAIYSHLASKTELLDALLDDTLALVEVPGSDRGGPQAGLVRLMYSTYDVLLANPGLLPSYLARQGARGPNAQRLGELMHVLLVQAGVPEPATREALRVLIVYTIGFAALATGASRGTEDQQPIRPRELRTNFGTGLGWLLAGIIHGT